MARIKRERKLSNSTVNGVVNTLKKMLRHAVQWGDVDWKNHVIHVRRSLYWATKQEQAEMPEHERSSWRTLVPKTRKSIRAIPLSPKLQKALEIHRITAPESPQEFVFCTKKGTLYGRKSIIDRAFFPALTRAGLRRIRFHDLRHTCATLLIAQGENPKVIQNYLGHATAQLTLDRYGHLMPQTSQDAAKKLDVMIFGPDTEPGANGKQTEQPELRYNKVTHGQGDVDGSPQAV